MITAMLRDHHQSRSNCILLLVKGVWMWVWGSECGCGAVGMGVGWWVWCGAVGVGVFIKNVTTCRDGGKAESLLLF